LIGEKEGTMTTTTAAEASQTQESVRQYYGETLETNQDLKTSACCTQETVAEHLKPLLGKVHDEVMAKFYGCGSPIPTALEGRTVLDLGCGSGRDSYVLSQLVGPTGRVIGVDMTDEQLAVARRHIDYHTERFGYDSPNVEFHQGLIEDLAAIGIEDASVDLVISNCVINLSADKGKVFSEINRVLKPGGELYFSDVFTGRRVPEALRLDPVLLGECLGGALYLEDFRRMLQAAGFADHRTVSRSPIALEDPQVEAQAGMIDFHSVTVRTFKCDFEDVCENYGHVAYYNGTVPESRHAFVLDDHHVFKTGMPVPVCGNTAKMLQETRYGGHFRVEGDFSVHYGLFDCGPDAVAGAAAAPEGGACC
jgi:arsenite methyltransferase